MITVLTNALRGEGRTRTLHYWCAVSIVLTAVVATLTAAQQSQPSDDELELERDLEYFVEPDEAMAPRTGDLES